MTNDLIHCHAMHTIRYCSIIYHHLLIEHYCTHVSRLRDELNVVDTSSPSTGTTMSARPHDCSSTEEEEAAGASASYLSTTVSDSYDADSAMHCSS